MKNNLSKKIGRFEIIRELGKGTQGVVHLAIDPVLDRHVAIKTLHMSDLSHKVADTRESLLKEARTISKIVHPNIVSIYEAGEDENQNPYLVFEYVDGQLLSEVMRQKGVMSVNNALELLKSVIEAMGHADHQNIIHCDIKPANILINADNTAKIMDFGIAHILSKQKSKTEGFWGTPRYMPPEYINELLISTSNDSYALGIILYEMLTGKPAFIGNDIKQIITSVIKDYLPPPSKYNGEVDPQFDSIVLKAIDKKIENRYQSSSELNAAIDEYLESHGANVSSSIKHQNATIEFLLRRIKRKKDFPALSESLFKINQIVSNDENSFDELANAIMQDFALTNKILKVVNSAHYRRAAGEVKTISRAVMLLGFDAIRSIAVSLTLVDHLHDKAQAQQLKEQVISCLYSGVFAKNLAEKSGIKNKEEVFLSGIFHNLGKLLSIFYFNEESLEIEELMIKESLSEEKASTQVLGVSYVRLGVAIAEEWELPHYIIDTINPYNISKNRKKSDLNDEEKIHAITCLSNELTELIENPDSNWREQSVKLWRYYTMQLKLSDRELTRLVEQAKEDLIDLNSILNINMSKSSLVRNLKNKENETADATILLNDNSEQTIIMEAENKRSEEVAYNEEQRKNILRVGIDDIHAMLREEYSVTDVFTLCMDVMYRAFKFDHAVVCLLNNKKHIMEAKFGNGITNTFLEQFKFPLKYQKDIFHFSLDKGVDVFITDTTDKKIQEKIPVWHQQCTEAETFFILPILVRNKPVALLYGDRFKSGELVIKMNELKLVHELRALAIQALIKKYQL